MLVMPVRPRVVDIHVGMCSIGKQSEAVEVLYKISQKRPLHLHYKRYLYK